MWSYLCFIKVFTYAPVCKLNYECIYVLSGTETYGFNDMKSETSSYLK